MGKGREVFKKTCSSTSSGVPYDFDSYQDDFHFNGDRIYLIFISESQEETEAFVIMMLSMYALMMTVTLLIRH